MGTDIYPVVERRVNGVWERVAVPQYTDESGYKYDYLTNRHYLKFAVLANVRNGYGFAGIPTNDAVTPISDQRGLPDDFVPPRDDEDDDWIGDHSFTWVTARELMHYDWTQPIRRMGVVPLDYFRKWDGLSQPKEWSGGVMGSNTLTITPEQASRGEYPPDAKIYVRIEWLITLKAALGGFYSDLLPWLYSLGEPDDVRIVMGFDS
jgi:hypothetical protein